MTMPALHPKSLSLRARRALPGRKVSPLKEGVAKTWTDRPPMPMPSAFTPSNPAWTVLDGGRLSADARRAARLGQDAALLALAQRAGPALGDLELDRRQRLGGVRRVMALGAGIAVQRGADARGAAEARDQLLHRVWRQHLAMLGAGGAGDRFVHQGAAEIVGAGLQAVPRALDA